MSQRARRLAIAPALVFVFTVVFGLWNVSTGYGQETPEGASTSSVTGESPREVAAESVAELTESPAPAEFSEANMAWMMICSALVLMMTAPGLALFYCGLVRKKNVLSVMMQCVTLMGIMSVLWVVVGYSLAFAPDIMGGFVGGFDHVMLDGVLPTWNAETGQIETPAAGTQIPTLLFAVFQMMFFIITPGLIVGAFAERMKFSAMVVYSILWGLLVYCPIAHWVWSDNGWLCEWNEAAAFPALDFAGGTVVHISSGVSALVCALMVGARYNYQKEPMPPHNLTYTFIGATMLWVGWFGFNAGSAVAANTLAVNAFAATHLAASAGVIAWAGMEWLTIGRPTILGACSGAVAGLVCITPASGAVTVPSAMIIGLCGGLVSFLACTKLKNAFGYDDSLDVFGVHGMSGIVGALLTGVFASKSITGARVGLIEGNGAQMVNQAVSILAAAGMAIVGSVILLKLIDLTIGLRVNEEKEIRGLDLTEHGEEGYIFL
ncbi:ammonium transporter [Rubinisphaera margarita]|uniref:ammonium transporter n=1 Tax=Rubinisphaera margarita TaxID=2909586 RepID=UPI001EE87331|nr:ammonium transporter [Rubinisphaera margarita]MCG6154436.1 ammonium transporter [Rubinisphaera margarita]